MAPSEGGAGTGPSSSAPGRTSRPDDETKLVSVVRVEAPPPPPPSSTHVFYRDLEILEQGVEALLPPQPLITAACVFFRWLTPDMKPHIRLLRTPEHVA